MSAHGQFEPVARSPKISRATFLKGALATGGALSLAGLLGACSGTRDEEDAAAEGLPIAPTGGSVGGPLAYYGWLGYDFTELLGDWQSANGVEIRPSFINGWNDITPRLLAGESFDVLNGDNGYNTIFEEVGVLTRIVDESLVPNLGEVNPVYVDRFRLADGSLTGIPFSWGSWGIVYNVDTVDNPPTKWTDLLEPEFRGRVAFLDDPAPAINIGALQIGADSPGRLSPSQLDDSLAWVRQFLDQAPTLSPSWGDVITLLDNGEVDVVFQAWPALKFFVSEGTNLEAVFPEDRSVSYVSTYWVPTTATNPASAYAFINHVISTEFQPQVPGWAGDAMVRFDLADQLEGSTADLYPYATAPQHLATHPLYELPRLEGMEEGVTDYAEWQAAWDQMKS